jgi:hypothetical protein
MIKQIVKDWSFELTAAVVLVASLLNACVANPVSGVTSTVGSWFGSHKTQLRDSGKVVVSEVAGIVEQTVFSVATDALDVALKGNNVSGFGDSLRSLESTGTQTAISKIPDTIAQLRQIWLPAQSHYTNLANQLGTYLQKELAGKTSGEQTAIIEKVIQGLQSPPQALQGP